MRPHLVGHSVPWVGAAPKLAGKGSLVSLYMFLGWLRDAHPDPPHLVIRNPAFSRVLDSWVVPDPGSLDAADASLAEHGWRRLSHWHPVNRDHHVAFVAAATKALQVPEFDPDDLVRPGVAPGYLYQYFAGFLAALVAIGDLLPGARLPGERDLAAEYGISIGTVRRATALLRDQGFVVTLPAKGTYVTLDPGTASTTIDGAPSLLPVPSGDEATSHDLTDADRPSSRPTVTTVNPSTRLTPQPDGEPGPGAQSEPFPS